MTDEPIPSEEEIQFILNEASHYLSPEIQVRRGDVLSAWAGIRPLVRNPNAKDTQSLVRNHLIYASASKLLTIAGGKWTTYREMAQETVDKAVELFGIFLVRHHSPSLDNSIDFLWFRSSTAQWLCH